MNIGDINKKIDKVYKEVDRYLRSSTNGSKKKLLRQYKIALEEIRKELSNIYQKHADDIANKKFSIDRLDSLRSQIAESIGEMKMKDAEVVKQNIKSVFSETYYVTGKGIESSIGMKLGFSSLSKSTIEAAINNPYDKIGWGNRSAKNISRLIQQTRDEITQGIIQGKSYAQTSKILSDKLSIGASKAIRIVRTESGRAVSQARKEVFESIKDNSKETGIEVAREWVPVFDDRTRDSHIEMEGQQADENDQFTLPDGTKTDGPRLSGIAEEDINCRCTERVVVRKIS